MPEQQREMTAEQYKAEVLKQRLANTVVNYEETIANQATQIAQLESELRRTQEELSSYTEDKKDDASGEE